MERAYFPITLTLIVSGLAGIMAFVLLLMLKFVSVEILM